MTTFSSTFQISEANRDPDLPLLQDLEAAARATGRWSAVTKPTPGEFLLDSFTKQRIVESLASNRIGFTSLDALPTSPIAEDLVVALQERTIAAAGSVEHKRSTTGQFLAPTKVIEELKNSGVNDPLNGDSSLYHRSPAINWALIRSGFVLNILDVEQALRQRQIRVSGMSDYGIFTETNKARTLSSGGEHGSRLLSLVGIDDLPDAVVDPLFARDVLLRVDISFFAKQLPTTQLVFLNGYAGGTSRDKTSREVVLPFLPPTSYITEVAVLHRAQDAA